jgi:hypothetical protein
VDHSNSVSLAYLFLDFVDASASESKFLLVFVRLQLLLTLSNIHIYLSYVVSVSFALNYNILTSLKSVPSRFILSSNGISGMPLPYAFFAGGLQTIDNKSHDAESLSEGVREPPCSPISCLAPLVLHFGEWGGVNNPVPCSPSCGWYSVHVAVSTVQLFEPICHGRSWHGGSLRPPLTSVMRLIELLVGSAKIVA